MNCSIPTDLIKVGRNPRYLQCGKKATHEVKNSDWGICKDHVEYAKSKKWSLKKLKGD